jgi:hypothetical protein
VTDKLDTVITAMKAVANAPWEKRVARNLPPLAAGPYPTASVAIVTAQDITGGGETGSGVYRTLASVNVWTRDREVECMAAVRAALNSLGLVVNDQRVLPGPGGLFHIVTDFHILGGH